tara:strand:- start:585 stop:887 length:303 start_codon:yes stop_codon:yes gene_type:complete
MKFLPFSDNVESFMKKYSVMFTLLVIYQGLFGGMSLSSPPERLVKLSDNVYVKLATMFAIAFTATKDVEIALVSIVLFVVVVNLIKTPEEKKASENFLNL